MNRIFIIIVAVGLIFLSSSVFSHSVASPTATSLIEEEISCLPGSIEQWSNPIREDGSRIWHYEETDDCEVNNG